MSSQADEQQAAAMMRSLLKQLKSLGSKFPEALTQAWEEERDVPVARVNAASKSQLIEALVSHPGSYQLLKRIRSSASFKKLLDMLSKDGLKLDEGVYSENLVGLAIHQSSKRQERERAQAARAAKAAEAAEAAEASASQKRRHEQAFPNEVELSPGKKQLVQKKLASEPGTAKHAFSSAHNHDREESTDSETHSRLLKSKSITATDKTKHNVNAEDKEAILIEDDVVAAKQMPQSAGGSESATVKAKVNEVEAPSAKKPVVPEVQADAPQVIQEQPVVHDEQIGADKEAIGPVNETEGSQTNEHHALRSADPVPAGIETVGVVSSVVHEAPTDRHALSSISRASSFDVTASQEEAFRMMSTNGAEAQLDDHI